MRGPGVPRWVGNHDTDPPPAPDGDPPPGPVGRSSRLQTSSTRILAGALWGAVALALLLGLVNLAGRPATAPAPAAGPAAPPRVAPPGGCAELVVAAWLAGDTDTLADVPGQAPSAPEPGRRRAVHTYTAAATPAEHAWGYLVGAQVEVRDPDGRWAPAGLWFFIVTMIPSEAGCQGWSPAALPAQVPAPQLGGGVPLPYPVTLPASGTPLVSTLEAFFAGLLTGAEDLERYLAPGVTVPAVVPPPYRQVSVTELRARDELAEPGAVVPAEGTLAQVLATVETDDGDDLPLVYPVTLAVRGGRWEVVALDTLLPAPGAWQSPPPSPEAAASATPTSPTSTP